MAKYHIGKNGPAPCKAEKRACRYGGESTHYTDLKDANTAYEKQLAEEQGGSFNKKQKSEPELKIVDKGKPLTKEQIKAYENLGKLSKKAEKPKDNPAKKVSTIGFITAGDKEKFDKYVEGKDVTQMSDEEYAQHYFEMAEQVENYSKHEDDARYYNSVEEAAPLTKELNEMQLKRNEDHLVRSKFMVEKLKANPPRTPKQNPFKGERVYQKEVDEFNAHRNKLAVWENDVVGSQNRVNHYSAKVNGDKGNKTVSGEDKNYALSVINSASQLDDTGYDVLDQNGSTLLSAVVSNDDKELGKAAKTLNDDYNETAKERFGYTDEQVEEFNSGIKAHQKVASSINNKPVAIDKAEIKRAKSLLDAADMLGSRGHFKMEHRGAHSARLLLEGNKEGFHADADEIEAELIREADHGKWNDPKKARDFFAILREGRSE